ncbi:hypothetical protein ACWCQL_18745 [Streptomyces sp. NPDC002073]
MALTGLETRMLRLLAEADAPVGTFDAADQLAVRPRPHIDAPDEDPVRVAWTEERIDLLHAVISLCHQGFADIAVPADGENGDRYTATAEGRAFLAR